MTHLYANENFPLPTVIELRRLGHDVLTVQETGKSGQAISDEAVLEYACSQGRVLLTLNRKHFIRLHKNKPEHNGIIVCTYDPDFIRLAQRIHSALETQDTHSGQLIRVNRPG
jgi:hypothetical protein